MKSLKSPWLVWVLLVFLAAGGAVAQEDGDVTGIPQETLGNGMMVDAINQPPNSRANAGFSFDSERWYVNGNVNYQDEAFWTDVLNAQLTFRF